MWLHVSLSSKDIRYLVFPLLLRMVSYDVIVNRIWQWWTCSWDVVTRSRGELHLIFRLHIIYLSSFLLVNVDRFLMNVLSVCSILPVVVGEPPLPPQFSHLLLRRGRVLRDPEVWKLGGKWRSTYVHDNASTPIWHYIFQGDTEVLKWGGGEVEVHFPPTARTPTTTLQQTHLRSIEKLQDRITNVSIQIIGWVLLYNKSEHTIHKKLHYRVTISPVNILTVGRTTITVEN